MNQLEAAMKAEKIRLENLKVYRNNIKDKLAREKKIYDTAYRLFCKRKESYERLLSDYKRLDYRIAELDGRLMQVSIEKKDLNPKEVLARALTKMSDEQKREFLKDLQNI